MRTPRGAWCFRAFLRVSWWFLSDFAALPSGVAGVAFGARMCRSACRPPTCVRIARFAVVSEQFCAFGRMAWGAQKSPHEPFFGIVRFVVVSNPFSARFCGLQRLRTDLSDTDVMRMHDLGAGIAFSLWFQSNVALLARPREDLKNSIRDGDSSIAATLVTSGS